MKIKSRIVRSSNIIDFMEKLSQSTSTGFYPISVVSKKMGVPGHLIVEKLFDCGRSDIVAMCPRKRVWIFGGELWKLKKIPLR